MLRAPCIDMPVVKPYSIRQHFRIRIPIATHSGRGNRAFTRFLRMLLCVQNEAAFSRCASRENRTFCPMLVVRIDGIDSRSVRIDFCRSPLRPVSRKRPRERNTLIRSHILVDYSLPPRKRRAPRKRLPIAVLRGNRVFGAIAYAPRCFTSRSGARSPIMHDHVHDKALRERQRNQTRQQV